MLAYPDLPEAHRRHIGLDTFHTTLGNAYLQRVLLAVAPENIESAVRAGNEFLRAKGYTSASQHVRGVTEEEEEPAKVNAIKMMEEQLTQMMAAILKLTEKMVNKGRYIEPRKGSGERKEQIICWNCEKPCHFKNKC